VSAASKAVRQMPLWLGPPCMGECCCMSMQFAAPVVAHV
jgi:hypothetical protein